VPACVEVRSLCRGSTRVTTTQFQSDWRITMIEFINVEKEYDKGTTALSNLNLKLEQGDFVAIIGLSGAGNSTLLRCINLMHNITGGQLLVDDIDISKLKGKQVRRFRRRIGMIFQSFNLVTRTSVLKNVLVS